MSSIIFDILCVLTFCFLLVSTLQKKEHLFVSGVPTSDSSASKKKDKKPWWWCFSKVRIDSTCSTRFEPGIYLLSQHDLTREFGYSNRRDIGFLLSRKNRARWRRAPPVLTKPSQKRTKKFLCPPKRPSGNSRSTVLGEYISARQHLTHTT